MNKKQVEKTIESLSDFFDSHAFIRKYMKKYPKSYGVFISQYKTLNAAHAQIGKFLLENAPELKIEYIGEIESLNVLVNPVKNALWKKQTNPS